MHFFSVGILDADIEHLEVMMQVSGAGSIQSLLLSALYNYGRHLECGLPTRAFDLARNRAIPRRIDGQD